MDAEIMEIEIMEIETLDAERENLNIGDTRSVWSDAAIKCLLDFMLANMEKVGKTFALKNKTKLWQKAAENLQLAAVNWKYTPSQVETKFRALERQYKKKILNNKMTGRSRMTCAYEDELEAIFKQKKGINPDYTLGVESLEDFVEPLDSPRDSVV